MADASEADKATAALNGSDLGGRTLTINEAKPKADRKRRPALWHGEETVVAMTIGVRPVSRANLAGSQGRTKLMAID